MYHDFETKTEAAIKRICWGLCGNAVAIKTSRVLAAAPAFLAELISQQLFPNRRTNIPQT